MKKVLLSLLGAVPVMLFAFSAGPPVKRTGAAVDGGTNCTSCHATYGPANSDARGSVVITAANYVPGVKQTLTVSVKHPEALRWGFQLIARTTADQTKRRVHLLQMPGCVSVAKQAMNLVMAALSLQSIPQRHALQLAMALLST